MFRYALKSTLAKKLRLLSTALSVMLGVAFLAGTLVFTDTIKRTFDDLFADIFDETDAYVRSAESVETDFGDEQRGRIPDSLVEAVRGVEGVADVQPFVQGYAQVVDAGGEAIGDPGQGAPTLGMSYVGGALSPWQLTPGSREPGPREVVLDKATFDDAGFEIGDTVTVLTQTGPQQLALVGTARFGSVDSPGGASVAIFDLATAQEVMLGRTGEVDALMVDGVEGIDEAVLARRVDAALPGDIETLTGSEITAEAQDSIQEGLSFFNTFLLVFAGIGLVVACFTIYNTFQIIVTQRAREMALLRAVGASRRQVLGAQLFEAVVVGLFASVVGLAAGVFVAGLLNGLLEAFGVDIPASGTVFLTRTAVVALVVGLLATVISAVFPSLRASRVPPLAALRDVVIEYGHQDGRRLVEGGVLTAGGAALLIVGLAQSEILFVGTGALLVFVGVFILGPLLARPVVRVLGAPLPAVSGIVGALARENASRNPKRTSRTGGALMVAVALVAAITIIAASAKAWTRDIFDEQFTGDFVVSTNTFGFGGISPQLTDDIAALPEVEAAAGIRVGAARVRSATGEGDTSYVAVDPEATAKVFDIGMVEGTVESLTTGGVLVDDDEARDRQVTVGDTVQFTFANGTTHALTVEGIYTEDELAGNFVVTHALHERSGVDQFDFSVYIMKAPGVSDADAQAAIAELSDAYPNAELQSRSEYIDAQAGQIDQLVNLMYGLLALAVVIALFSIANSMALSIYERTRELGLLRAVGTTRRQIRRSVRLESVLVAVLGSGLGLVIGVFFGWAISVSLGGGDVFTLPIVSLVVIVVIAIIGAVVAAMRPAARAARLDVLRAIASQ